MNVHHQPIKTVALGVITTKLGRGSDSKEAVRKMLAKLGVDPVVTAKGKGPIYLYDADAVSPIIEKYGKPKATVPTHTTKLPDDDVLADIFRKLDGIGHYVCGVGEQHRATRSSVEHQAAQLRVITIGLNRLLKAAGLHTVPETPAASGDSQ